MGSSPCFARGGDMVLSGFVSYPENATCAVARILLGKEGQGQYGFLAVDVLFLLCVRRYATLRGARMCVVCVCNQ